MITAGQKCAQETQVTTKESVRGIWIIDGNCTAVALEVLALSDLNPSRTKCSQTSGSFPAKKRGMSSQYVHPLPSAFSSIISLAWPPSFACPVLTLHVPLCNGKLCCCAVKMLFFSHMAQMRVTFVHVKHAPFIYFQCYTLSNPRPPTPARPDTFHR